MTSPIHSTLPVRARVARHLAQATKGATGQPLDNPARDVWIQETALSTALNTSYIADQISLFGIVVGIALLLSGFGFAILAIGGALRNPESAVKAVMTRRAGTHTPAATGV
jgi:hypothetical protein